MSASFSSCKKLKTEQYKEGREQGNREQTLHSVTSHTHKYTEQ